MKMKRKKRRIKRSNFLPNFWHTESKIPIKNYEISLPCRITHQNAEIQL